MGGKTATSTSQVAIPPSVLAQYNSVNAKANQTASQPFQDYGGEFVAPTTATQNAGIAGTNTYANAAQPYYGAAATGLGAAQNATNPVNAAAEYGTAASASPLTGQQIGQYLSPYLNTVEGATANVLNQNNQQQQAGQLGNAITSGAFGGDRTGIAAANLEEQQNLANAQIYSGIANQGYNTALGTATTEQGIGLQGASQLAGIGQTAYGEGANTASGLASLGTASQTAGLQGSQAQIEAGTVQQQTQQAQDTAEYNQFLQQQSYPFQVDQFLANIAEGTGALSGSTTTTQQPGGFFSDERLKEDMEEIGRTFDGQPIYRYKMRGDDREQIGLSAQKVEKKHPAAVGLAGGYRFVDYGKATDAAANRGHFYSGGVAGPCMHERKAYAYGGGPDNSGLGAVLAAQQNMYSNPGSTQRNIGPGQNASHQLAVASGTPAPPPSGASTTQQVVGLGKDAYQGYKWYTKPSGVSAGQTGSASAGLDTSGPAAAAGDTAGAADVGATSGAAAGAGDAAAAAGAETAGATAAEGAVAGAGADAAAETAAAIAAEYAAADAATVAVMAAKRGGKVRRGYDTGGMPYSSDTDLDIPDEQTSAHLMTAGPVVKQPTGLQTAMKMGDPNQASTLAGGMFSNTALAHGGGVAGRRGYDGGGAPSQDDDPDEVLPDATPDTSTAVPSGVAAAPTVTPQKTSLWNRIKEHATAENVIPILSGLAAMGTAKTRSPGVALAAGLGAGSQSYLDTQASLAKTSEEQQRAKGLTIANQLAAMKNQAAASYLTPGQPASGQASGTQAPVVSPTAGAKAAQDIDSQYRQKYFVQPWLPEEQAQLQKARGAAIALGTDEPVKQAQAQRDQRVQNQTATNQNAAQAEADRLYATATDPTTDPATQQAALAKYNAVHQWTGDTYTDSGGVKTNSRTGAPAVGVAAQQLSPQSWVSMMNEANRLVDVPQGTGESIQMPNWRAHGAATPAEYAKQLASAAPPPPQSTAGAPAPPMPATPPRRAPVAATLPSTASAPPANISDPYLARALTDPTYKVKTAPVRPGVTPTPAVLDQQKATVGARTQLLKDSEDATNAGANSLQYLEAARTIMDSKGATMGYYGPLLTKASQLMGGGPQATNYQEIAKYLGNAAVQAGRTNFPNATQSEVGLQLNELSPSVKMTDDAIKELLSTNIRSSRYTVDSANRVKSYVDSGGDPQNFHKWNQQYYPRENLINATKTATGPKGQKLYLVNGKWVQ